MKYYTLSNGVWSHNSQRTVNLEGKRFINLYNDHCQFIGVGIY